jgi:hypothetical protein
VWEIQGKGGASLGECGWDTDAEQIWMTHHVGYDPSEDIDGERCLKVFRDKDDTLTL